MRVHAFSVAVALLACACGGLLGLDSDADDGDGSGTGSSSGAPADGAVAESATGGGDGSSSDGGDTPDGGTSDVQVTPALLPRVATFEMKNLVSSTDGADQAPNMAIAMGPSALYGTYSAKGAGGGALAWYFDTAPADEMYLAFLFRIDAMPATKAAFAHLAFGKGAALRTVDVGVDKDGVAGVATDGTNVTFGPTVTKSVAYICGVHVKASTGLLEVAIATPTTKLGDVTLTTVTWSAAPPVVEVDLVANNLGATYDEVHMSATAFPN